MNAPFIVDRETGWLRFPELPLELRPMMPEAEFIATTAKLNLDNLGATHGWQRYSIRQLISNDRRLGLFLIILNGRLNKLSFAYAQKDESWGPGRSRASWNAKRNTARSWPRSSAGKIHSPGKNRRGVGP